MARILLIDDDPGIRDTLSGVLRVACHAVETAETGEEGLARAVDGQFDLVISDMKMPGLSGIDLLRKLRSRHIDAAAIILTGFGTIETAVESMKLGAVDFVEKPVFEAELLARVGDALGRRAAQRTARHAIVADPLEALIGDSPQIARVRSLTLRAAAATGTVLITGETGTGKELVARALHVRSRRSSGPFLAFNCAAVSEMRLEQELFGHVQAAFPGALEQRAGLVEQAHGGTLFVNEIGALEKSLQARLLEVLDTGEVRRLGEAEGRRVDVRFVAATNAELAAAVLAGRFRGDLFYRLNVHHIHLPPLRERASDVQPLGEHFLRKHGGVQPPELTAEAWSALLSYDFPGNVRELEHVIQRAVAVAQGRTIGVSDLPEPLSSAAEIAGHGDGVAAARERAERRVIVAALNRNRGDLPAAARELHVSRTTLWRLMRKHGIKERNP